MLRRCSSLPLLPRATPDPPRVDPASIAAALLQATANLLCHSATPNALPSLFISSLISLPLSIPPCRTPWPPEAGARGRDGPELGGMEAIGGAAEAEVEVEVGEPSGAGQVRVKWRQDILRPAHERGAGMEHRLEIPAAEDVSGRWCQRMSLTPQSMARRRTASQRPPSTMRRPWCPTT